MPADEDGTLYAAELAVRAGNTPGPAARAELEAIRRKRQLADMRPP